MTGSGAERVTAALTDRSAGAPTLKAVAPPRRASRRSSRMTSRMISWTRRQMTNWRTSRRMRPCRTHQIRRALVPRLSFRRRPRVVALPQPMLTPKLVLR